jgi:hypothetical protein
MKFTKEQNKVLSEIYRRLIFLNNGDVNKSMLLLTTPSTAKKITKLELIKPYSKEIPRVYNWYSLTEKGKGFFSHYVIDTHLDSEMNTKLFTGEYVKEFDPSFL